MTFAQRRYRLTTRFSGRIPVVKPRMTVIQHHSDTLQAAVPQEATIMADTHVTTPRHTLALQQNQLLNLIESRTYFSPPEGRSPMLQTKATETDALTQLTVQKSIRTHFILFAWTTSVNLRRHISPASERFRREAHSEENINNWVLGKCVTLAGGLT
jgi:hypothetical protein